MSRLKISISMKTKEKILNSLFFFFSFFFTLGVLKEPFVVKLLNPDFYKGLTKEMRDEWQKRTGKSALNSVEEFLIENVGAPLNKLFR